MPVRNSRQLRTYRRILWTWDTRLEIWAADDDEHDVVSIKRAPFNKSFTSCYIGHFADLLPWVRCDEQYHSTRCARYHNYLGTPNSAEFSGPTEYDPRKTPTRDV